MGTFQRWSKLYRLRKKHFKFGSFQEKDQIEKHGAHHIQYGFFEKAEFSCTICIYIYIQI